MTEERTGGRATAARVAVAIRNHAKLYKQSCFAHRCGTPACIAGFTVWLAAGEPEDMDLSAHYGRPVREPGGNVTMRVNDVAVQQAAEAILEVDEYEGILMFTPWPYGKEKETPPQAAAEMLEYYAKTGVVRWGREQEAKQQGRNHTERRKS